MTDLARPLALLAAVTAAFAVPVRGADPHTYHTLAHPEKFHSLVALPGFPPSEEEYALLDRLAEKPVRLFVGGDDTGWIERMRAVERRLGELGADVTLEVLPGEGHVPPSLDGGRVMEELEAVRAKLAEDAVTRVLDALHDAASKAQGERYFSLFTPDAVFFGTDPAERWTLDEFHAYADPHFSAGHGWTYEVVSRHVRLAASGATAWFDEELDNVNYGRCRGTGVLLDTADGWKIVQYNLSIPVPNDLAESVVGMIRGAE